MDHICISLKNADELPVRVKHKGQECAGKDHPDCEYRHEMGKLDVTGRVEIEGHDELVGKEVLVDAIGEGVDQRQRGHVHLGSHFHKRSGHGRECGDRCKQEVEDDAGNEGRE